MKQLRKWTVAAFCSLAGVLYAQTPSYSTYQVNKDLTNFTDWTASSLSKNFKDKHLKGMESQLMKQLAEKMLRGDYNSAYLLQSLYPQIRYWSNNSNSPTDTVVTKTLPGSIWKLEKM